MDYYKISFDRETSEVVVEDIMDVGINEVIPDDGYIYLTLQDFKKINSDIVVYRKLVKKPRIK